MHVNSATYREMPSCSDCYSVVYTTISPPHMYYISCYGIVHYLHYYNGPTCYGTVHYLQSTVTGTAIQYRAKKVLRWWKMEHYSAYATIKRYM
jgi:hypothetical protein